MALDTMRVIADGRAELKQWVERRDAADKRIAELRAILRSLLRFMPEQQRTEVLREIEEARRNTPSLTEAISAVLRSTKIAMTANEIRDALEQSGFDLESYSQPLGAIMTTLNRLADHKADQRNVRRGLRADKTITYQWIESSEGKK